MKHAFAITAALAALSLAATAQAQGKSQGKGHGAGNPHAAGGKVHSNHSDHQRGSERSREVHRMLAAGENPGHHYGRDGDKPNKADKHRGKSHKDAKHNRTRGAAARLADNPHASARGVERGSMSTTRAERARADRVRTERARNQRARAARVRAENASRGG